MALNYSAGAIKGLWRTSFQVVRMLKKGANVSVSRKSLSVDGRFLAMEKTKTPGSLLVRLSSNVSEECDTHEISFKEATLNFWQRFSASGEFRRIAKNVIRGTMNIEEAARELKFFKLMVPRPL